MVKQCLYCNKDFRTYPSKVKIGRGKYCSKDCERLNFLGKHFSRRTEWPTGKMPWSFKGYRYQIARKGGKKYKLLYKPDYVGCDVRGYIREHRYILELALGRRLKKDEIAHHINGDSLDNRIENLEVMTKIEHDRMNTPLNIHKRWQKEVVSHPRTE